MNIRGEYASDFCHDRKSAFMSICVVAHKVKLVLGAHKVELVLDAHKVERCSQS